MPATYADVTDADDLTEMDLGELAATANRHYANAQAAGRAMLESAWHAGSALIAAKAQVRHGEWAAWLDANWSGSDRTARAYMRIATPNPNRQSSADLDAVVPASINAALRAMSGPKHTPKPPPDPPTSSNRQRGKTPSPAGGATPAGLTTTPLLDEVIDRLDQDIDALADGLLRNKLSADAAADVTALIARLQAIVDDWLMTSALHPETPDEARKGDNTMNDDTSPYDELFVLAREWLQRRVGEPFSTDYGPSLRMDGLPAVGLRGPAIAFEDGPDEWAFDIANDDRFLAAAAERGVSFDCYLSWVLCLGPAQPRRASA